MSVKRLRPWRSDSRNGVSGEPGAVQTVPVTVACPGVELPCAGAVLGFAGPSCRFGIDIDADTIHVDFTQIQDLGSAVLTFASLDSEIDCPDGTTGPGEISGVTVTTSHATFVAPVTTTPTSLSLTLGEPVGPTGPTRWNPGDFIELALDFAGDCPGVAVEIDIKPWSDTNLVYPFSEILMPVAILGSEDFDAANVDVTTLAFGPDGTSPVSSIFEDVNEDGLMDLLLDYRTAESGIDLGDEKACVTGKIFDGTPFEACDSVRIVCDVDDNQEVDINDVDAIFAARGTAATGPDDPMGANDDGIITVNDGRICVLECTNSVCAVSPPPLATSSVPVSCGLLGIEPFLLLGLPLWARRRRAGCR
jgi:hypothetical protein